MRSIVESHVNHLPGKSFSKSFSKLKINKCANVADIDEGQQ